jgi:hypothetical protein
MPNRWAVATGNWSSTATWNNGAVLGIPTGSDDVFISGSGFTVTIDQDINVLSLNNRPSGSGAGAIAAGGNFTVVTSRNIKADLNTIGGATTVGLMSISGTGITVNITGSLSGSNTSNTIVSLGVVSSNINISGSYIIGGSNGSQGCVHINVGGIIGNNITISANTIIGGTAGFGILFGTVGTGNNIRIIGDLYGGSAGVAVSIAPTSPFTASIIGNSFNTLGASGLTISSTGLGTVTMTGSINGGLGSLWHGASMTANNLTFNFTGSINGAGAGGSDARGIAYTSNGTNSTLNIAGSVNGGAGGTAIRNEGVATINATGSATGGSVAASNGILNTGTAIVNISGSATGGGTSTSFGVSNTSTGTVRVTTAVASLFAAGLNNTLATGTGSFESAIYASNGTQPWSGFCKLRSGSNNFITTATDTGGTKTLVDPNNALFGLPAASDVRLGTSYNFGANTGTCAIPSASQVAVGIVVDNTVGTAVLTAASVASSVWNTQTTAITVSGSIGDRFKNSATVSSTGDQIAALTI